MAKIREVPLTPSTHWYQPVTWKELVDAAIPLSSEQLKQGTVPWSGYRKFAIDCLRQALDEWYSARSQERVFYQIEGSKENGLFLDLVRELTLGIYEYSETSEVLAWSVNKEAQIAQLRQKIELYQFGLLLERRLANKQLELDTYDEVWGFKKQVRALESALLKEYKKYSLETMSKLISTLNGMAKGSKRAASLKPSFRPVYTPLEFEHLCAEWMSFLGFTGVSVSKASGDGGVDVFANGAIAQVKFYNVPIGVAPIRELVGASLDYHAKPVFFCSMAYTQAAIDFAERNSVALFTVDIFESTLRASSSEASNLLGG